MPTSPSKKSMVGWYDPRQLINTGLQVLISDLIGTRIDSRREQALASAPQEGIIDYRTAGPSAFWFDYMSDTGDGWDSTFHMAKLVSGPVQIGSDVLPRGEFLLLGGDQIYPYASKKEYRERLVVPFEAASCPAGDPPRLWDLYSIPGNHDWYDGLISFLRQFTQQRKIGSWRTKQSRSYFALQLPHRWWLWAVDTQLENDLDRPQVEYFRAVAEQMSDGDRLIVCIAEPDWLYGKMENDPTLMNNLAFLLGKKGKAVFGDKNITAYLTLSGDLHHYRRHEHATDPSQQKIVSGGGGAFLYPTHFNKVDTVMVYDDVFKLKKETQFPSEATCFWLTFKNLLFPFINPWFGILTGLLYLLLAWRVIDFEWTLSDLFRVFTESSTRLAMISLVWIGFYYFTEGGRWFRLLWGAAIHGTAHVLAALWVVGLANRWCDVISGASLNNWKVALCRLGVLFVGGYIVGAFVMGLYLLLSLNVWRHHHNEAFSSLRIKHYKNFLRIRINPDGTLDVFPVGVPSLNKPPILIEGPIRLTPA